MVFVNAYVQIMIHVLPRMLVHNMLGRKNSFSHVHISCEESVLLVSIPSPELQSEAYPSPLRMPFISSHVNNETAQ